MSDAYLGSILGTVTAFLHVFAVILLVAIFFLIVSGFVVFYPALRNIMR